MRQPTVMLIACCAVAALAGCGSGAPTSSSSSSSTTPTSTPKASTGSLKVQGTPKFGAPPASGPVLSGVVQVAYRNIAINPDVIRVKVGSTIRWTNYDSTEHNVTSAGGPQSFRSGNFGEGHSFELTASRPGIIHYLCTIHPASMNGTIQVVP